MRSKTNDTNGLGKKIPGTIQRYETKSGVRYRALGLAGKKRVALGVHRTEEAALEALKAFYSSPRPTVEVAPTWPCLLTWCPVWVQRRKDEGNHRSMKDTEACVRNRITSHPIARVPFKEITPKMVKDWMRTQAATQTKQGTRPKRSTVLNSLNCLRVVLRDAIEEELFPGPNPAAGIRVAKETRTDEPRTMLQLEELKLVLGAKVLTPQSRNMIQFSFFSGLRAGEVAGLRWKNVDWKNGLLFVQYSYDGPTKAGKPRKAILMPQAREALEAQQALGLPGEYVFPGRMGNCRSHSVLRQLKAACREVGIERNVVAHSLRHSFCTIMLRKFNPYVVKTLAGHSSITTTMRYAHTIGDDIEKAVQETTFTL